jgi:metal-dependent amidase/aminoacylase/carboxypeptidase family protein
LIKISERQSMIESEHHEVRAAIDAAVEATADTLLEVSHAIHENPELAFAEHFACATLADALRERELPVSTGVYTLPTAFESTINPKVQGPTVAVLAEYDALPEIGHACGHNIIATTALGAGLCTRRGEKLSYPAESSCSARLPKSAAAVRN